MTQIWQLQDAKNRFSQVVDNALRSGPQIITRHGQEVVIVLSVDEYRQMKASQGKLSDFFRESPLAGLDLDMSRDTSLPREGIQL